MAVDMRSRCPDSRIARCASIRIVVTSVPVRPSVAAMSSTSMSWTNRIVRTFRACGSRTLTYPRIVSDSFGGLVRVVMRPKPAHKRQVVVRGIAAVQRGGEASAQGASGSFDYRVRQIQVASNLSRGRLPSQTAGAALRLLRRSCPRTAVRRRRYPSSSPGEPHRRSTRRPICTEPALDVRAAAAIQRWADRRCRRSVATRTSTTRTSLARG